MNKKKKRVLIVSSAVASVCAVAVVVCGLNELLGYSLTEVDINSGKIRTRILFLRIAVSTTEKPTRFFQAVDRNGLQKTPADYRFAYGTTVGAQKLFGTPRVSSQYADAIASMDGVMEAFDVFPSLRESEHDVLTRLMDLLHVGDQRGMRDYVNDLVDTANRARRSDS